MRWGASKLLLVWMGLSECGERQHEAADGVAAVILEAVLAERELGQERNAVGFLNERIGYFADAVGDGGAKFDSNGFDISALAALSHDDRTVAAAVDARTWHRQAARMRPRSMQRLKKPRKCSAIC